MKQVLLAKTLKRKEIKLPTAEAERRGEIDSNVLLHQRDELIEEIA